MKHTHYGFGHPGPQRMYREKSNAGLKTMLALVAGAVIIGTILALAREYGG